MYSLDNSQNPSMLSVGRAETFIFFLIGTRFGHIDACVRALSPPTRPRQSVHLVPFQRNEYVPKISEQTIGASGPAEGAIRRNTMRFTDNLSPNLNPDIIFRGDSNDNRMMTKLCADRLSVLAILVANQWPGVMLEVAEGWVDVDKGRLHPENSLHYEGRAVDVVTSDGDLSKYLILARLAVDVGFDWVYYETSHVHCSVKSGSSDAALSQGCFPGTSLVPGPGRSMVKMQDLQTGDKVYSLDIYGEIAEDVIIAFMDVQRDVYRGKNWKRAFVSLHTENGEILHLTTTHLVYVSKTNVTSGWENDNDINLGPRLKAIFARNVRVGNYLNVLSCTPLSTASCSTTMQPSRVTKVELVDESTGAYAPLTTRGTIVVENVLASCYAIIEDDNLAHIAMTPLRYYHVVRHWLTSWLPRQNLFQLIWNFFASDQLSNQQLGKKEGIAFYSKIIYFMLCKISSNVCGRAILGLLTKSDLN